MDPILVAFVGGGLCVLLGIALAMWFDFEGELKIPLFLKKAELRIGTIYSPEHYTSIAPWNMRGWCGGFKLFGTYYYLMYCRPW